ncbi:hypothetical protein HanRHA438_Chr05g0245031 [Helianthus annuus]|nr:hypothetical protein HanRHA438_Chr05g0245031 [Helianthus annuus]
MMEWEHKSRVPGKVHACGHVTMLLGAAKILKHHIHLLKAICKTTKEIAKPIIAEQIPKFKIDSVEFQHLTLWSLPPTFQGNLCFFLKYQSICCYS